MSKRETSERKEVIRRLKALRLDGKSRQKTMAEVAKAIYGSMPVAYGEEFRRFRDKLVSLLEEDAYDAGYAAAAAQAKGDLAKSGWYRALDRKGKAIRIGDRTTDDKKVARIIFTGAEEWEPLVKLTVDDVHLDEFFCSEIEVATLPDVETVESVLCELLEKVDDDRAGQAEVIAEYAKRLRLAGDVE